MFWPHPGYTLNLALVYQDALTRRWARDVQALIGKRIGNDSVRCTEWDISRLKQGQAFTEGVVTLTQADVIVIANHGENRLPGEFYLWVNLWLQQRSRLTGALVALVAGSEESKVSSGEVQEYLKAVAAQGRLEFFLKECELKGEPPIRRDDVIEFAEAA
jgi:hypothetical protein